jgi:hypothetical protein
MMPDNKPDAEETNGPSPKGGGAGEKRPATPDELENRPEPSRSPLTNHGGNKKD